MGIAKAVNTILIVVSAAAAIALIWFVVAVFIARPFQNPPSKPLSTSADDLYY
jgi:hypothetical protein